MKKILYIAVPIVVLIALSIFLFSQKKQATEESEISSDSSESAMLPASTPGSQQAFDPITGMEIAEDNMLLENTPSGQVKINDFAKLAEKADNGVIYPVDKKNYNIGYNPTNQEFIVTLLVTKDIEDIRQDAEKDLLDSLGISRLDACKLKVYLYVSAALTKDDRLPQNHGLSFCPGSQSF